MSSTKGLFYPISIIQGETLDISFDISFDGELLDPSGLSIVGQFGTTYETDIQESFTFSFVEDDTDSYITHAVYPAEDSSLLEVGKYTYQIQFTDENSKVKTILYGSMDVLQSFIH